MIEENLPWTLNRTGVCSTEPGTRKQSGGVFVKSRKWLSVRVANGNSSFNTYFSKNLVKAEGRLCCAVPLTACHDVELSSRPILQMTDVWLGEEEPAASGREG